jgi:2-polyprenyl-6-methoxyphenol hydroxylase-like FAD-dependent oxidoreductase
LLDVIIIGGGPVGFINALGLAQAGVRVSVIEAEPQIIATDPEFLLQRLMFTKSLKTPPLLENAR